ncbi:MAG: L-seryl-tRNA(Sec) selenium transferase [Planctomycetes bacterium]|nr:L-seryl-tRNA(Sec) selenium transferase [Planctomycetota bacterium]MBI3845933.1 L-seryl-tRNA(Sec) selenium transferase [Planctomycetota bacterium]
MAVDKASTGFRNTWLRRIPSVEKLLASDEGRAIVSRFPRLLVLTSLRQILEEARIEIRDARRPDDIESEVVSADRIFATLEGRLAHSTRPGLRRVANATGVVLHTGLGRAPLADAAREAIIREAAGYALLEVDADTGGRSHRDQAIESLLCELTGAEAATVVNNNAAATYLIVGTLAAGREVVISRGQLVEIGGSYRLPDVMAASGARLVEVGTTNRTYLDDYRRAIGENTGALLRVHTSNYRLQGYVADVSIADLVRLGRERGLPVIDDLGSGSLTDLTRFGFGGEPWVRKSIDAGADVACFSTDKLVGGPQGGAIVGKREIVARIRRNPLARAVRVDKLTLAALEATLCLYRDEERVFRDVPTLRMLSMPLPEIERAAARLRASLATAVPALRLTLMDGSSQLGGGSLPGQDLPTRVVSVESDALSAAELAGALRRRPVPVFARVQRERLLLDPRTLLPGDVEEITRAFHDILEHDDEPRRR